MTSLSVVNFSDKGTTNFENLHTRISNITNVNDMLNLVSQHILLLENDNIALSLRILARIIRNARPEEIQKLSYDERYIKLTKKAKESIDKFNEFGNIFH